MTWKQPSALDAPGCALTDSYWSTGNHVLSHWHRHTFRIRLRQINTSLHMTSYKHSASANIFTTRAQTQQKGQLVSSVCAPLVCLLFVPPLHNPTGSCLFTGVASQGINITEWFRPLMINLCSSLNGQFSTMTKKQIFSLGFPSWCSKAKLTSLKITAAPVNSFHMDVHKREEIWHWGVWIIQGNKKKAHFCWVFQTKSFQFHEHHKQNSPLLAAESF